MPIETPALAKTTPPDGAAGSWGAAIFLGLFGLVFLGFGVFGFIHGLGLWQRHAAKAVSQTLFPLIFVAVGALIVVGGFWVRLGPKRQAALRADHPDEPWLWNKAWTTGRITDSNKAAMIGTWAITVIWNGISSPLLFTAAPAMIHKHDLKVLLVLVFPLAGMIFLIWAVRATIEFSRFGTSVFEPATMPGVIGGHLVGVIYTKVRTLPVDGFDVRLRCINVVTTGTGDSHRTTAYVRWEDQETIVRTVGDQNSGGMAVPVSFVIPFDCPECSDTDSNNRILWRLTVTAKVPGVDYSATFEVPVFRTADSRDGGDGGVDPIAAYRKPEEPLRSPSDRGITMTTLPGGVEFYFGPARTPGSAAVMTSMGILFMAAGWFARQGGAPLLFALVFSGTGLLTLWAGLNLWFGSMRVTIVSGEVRLRKRRLVTDPTKVYATDTIRGFAAQAMPTQKSQNTCYQVMLMPRAGGNVLMGANIKDKREAEWIAAQMSQAAGCRSDHG